LDDVATEDRVRARCLGLAGYFDLGEVGGLADDARVFLITCPHCGRQWMVPDRALGAVALAARSHLGRCAGRSPAQRRLSNALDEARWRRRRPVYPVVNDPDHPGLAGGIALRMEPIPPEPPMSLVAEALMEG
jgi:hypothetical protein